MEAIKGILFDLDGVFYIGDKVIEGAQSTLAWCRQRNIPYRFITNTSTKTTSAVASKLQALGLQVTVADIFSAVNATVDFLSQQGAPSVHLLIRDSAKVEFEQFEQETSNPDYVVVGDIGAAWDYALLNRVFRELMAGSQLIAMHKNKYFQTEQGLQMDIGAFVVGLEFLTGNPAIVIGKPSASFFQLATDALGLRPEQVVIVGDDIENDIGGGQVNGLKGVLVRTGKYREEVANASSVKPDGIIGSIAELPTWLESRRE